MCNKSCSYSYMVFYLFTYLNMNFDMHRITNVLNNFNFQTFVVFWKLLELYKICAGSFYTRFKTLFQYNWNRKMLGSFRCNSLIQYRILNNVNSSFLLLNNICFHFLCFYFYISYIIA